MDGGIFSSLAHPNYADVMTGVVGMLTFAILNGFLVYLYCNTYLGVDGEEMGQYDLLTEGFMNSAAFFLVRTFDSMSVGDLSEL